ncbi:ArsR/SmtB family transcription factor [Nitriliruptor alkaliphilus]|uniref:ArsR/SmtB family transcription factor n=1 Tax=Nitriliruptor alkaliphilus TaxID=427918 RepID=UPI0006986824|nr:metalloregulator ArsR/SmtB family transcription factor [Nitriliruptor alkaliphilus]
MATVQTQLGAGEALDGLAVLADPVRRQLLVHLVDRDVCTCGDLVEELGVGQPTVSHHLKVLREAGLVAGERCGRYVNYTVVPERLRALGASVAALGERAAERPNAC